ncbi:ferredoxin : Ferredoxin OS=Geitlerinema sp. PCC 7407 GN=GEI7407_2951 PE=4 SV=1: Fer2 [Gemmataceae bacterium]|nr:ferredoxin : Ferredoxin OS=Geitlerinema sp. PCC 7407 GN=GEI7407_2951 PE=4 SV=1: Fer2 [Gemmataceae bacterium]VTU01063.1 ferredoxin : Ferredoxin OS=Geitlerinema sp. PCC 7407 GN=GEI7407_2951 PE=4 SV=1: Fer2 [Gemmataceae bacterium]
MKSVTMVPVGGQLEVATGSRLVEGLLSQDLEIDMACGGRGLCATCHVYLRAGKDCVSPPSARELRTLGLLATADPDSRLACQCHIEGNGIVVEVPEGMYVQSVEQVDALVGTVAGYDYLHPITGQRLIPKGKLITRSIFNEFVSAAKELKRVRETPT